MSRLCLFTPGESLCLSSPFAGLSTKTSLLRPSGFRAVSSLVANLSTRTKHYTNGPDSGVWPCNHWRCPKYRRCCQGTFLAAQCQFKGQLRLKSGTQNQVYWGESFNKEFPYTFEDVEGDELKIHQWTDSTLIMPLVWDHPVFLGKIFLNC